MTAPRGRRGSDGGGGGAAAAMEGSSLRGALLIVVAVIVGVVLLGKGLEGGFVPSTAETPSEQAGGNDDGDTPPVTDETGSTVTTVPTPTTHAPAAVKVQILNGGGPAGSAGASSDALNAQGFVASADDTDDVAATAVYFAPGFEADAAVVATTLNITAVPAALPATPPTNAAADSGVVVVLGPDFTPPA
jgi:hypothetical protein